MIPIDALRAGVDGRRAVHHHQPATFTQLVDRADGIDGAVQSAAGIEVFLDGRQEILAGAAAFAARAADTVLGCDPGVLQRLVRGDAFLGIDRQTAVDELAGGLGDVAPVLDGSERVICHEDGLHLLEVRFPIEWRVATEEEVGDDPDGPDIPALHHQHSTSFYLIYMVEGESVHRLPMTRLLEDFWRHIPRRPARRRQHVELLLIHDAREPKVGNQQVGIILGGPEQQVLGLEVAVDDAMVMQVRNGGQRRPDQVRRIALVVAAFAADAVEEFAAECEFGNKVNCLSPGQHLYFLVCGVLNSRRGRGRASRGCWSRTIVHRLKVINQRQDILVAH